MSLEASDFREPSRSPVAARPVEGAGVSCHTVRPADAGEKSRIHLNSWDRSRMCRRDLEAWMSSWRGEGCKSRSSSITSGVGSTGGSCVRAVLALSSTPSCSSVVTRRETDGGRLKSSSGAKRGLV